MLKATFKILFLFALLSTQLSTQLFTLHAATPDVEDPRYKQRKYRRFVLPNQMKVFLISDPTAAHAAASMTVAVGSLSDPKKYPGMAHILEHMLFLGTKKYPEVGEYQKFISTHDGYANAYTAEDHVNYHFQIAPAYLENALDRFSQFFIAPSLNADFLQREIKVVNSEHSKNIANDFRRIYQVQRVAFAENHPLRHFATGNSDTLSKLSRKEIAQFYENNYSSNLMNLVVVGKEDLGTLEQWVRSRFEAVSNKKIPEPKFPSMFMKPDKRFRLLEVKTIKDSRSLTLMFPLPSTWKHYRSRPTTLLGFLIGHEGKGSLLSLLKKEDLATGLAAGGGFSTRSYEAFSISVQLTPRGLKQYKKVIQRVFQYLHLLRDEGLPPYLYQEVQRMTELDYLFAAKSEGAALVNSFSANMRYIPLEGIETLPYQITEYNPKLFDSLLFRLTPKNMLAILAARSLSFKRHRVEPYYGVEFRYTKNHPEWVGQWSRAPKHSGLHLPEPNPFIPQNLNVNKEAGPFKLTHESLVGLAQEQLPEPLLSFLKTQEGKVWRSWQKFYDVFSKKQHELQQIISIPEIAPDDLRLLIVKHASPVPKLLMDTERAKLWFQQDYKFQRPRAKILLRIHTPKAYSSARNSVLGQLYVQAIQEALNEFSYPLSQAGLSFDISIQKKGISLSVSGYSDRVLDLAKVFSGKLKQITISEATFASIKERLFRNYRNFPFQQPYQQAFYLRSVLLEASKFTLWDYDKALQSITLQDLKKYTQSLYAQNYIEGVAYGNLETLPVYQGVQNLIRQLGGTALPKEKRFVEDVIQIESGKHYAFTRKMVVENSAMVMDIQVGQETPRLRAALGVIAAALTSPLYTELRTQQQLGYLVSSGMTQKRKTLSLYVFLQSGKYSAAQLEQRTNAFLKSFFNGLKDMPASELNTLRQSLLSAKLQKTSDTSQETGRLFSLAFVREVEFDQNSKDIKALQELTLADIKELLQKHLIPATQRRLVLRMIGKDHLKAKVGDLIIQSPEAFKQEHPCPQFCAN